MKRLHVHVSVDDLAQSTWFYSTLFAADPTVVKDDYVKWMLDDPRVNFAISTRPGRAAGTAGGTTCCRMHPRVGNVKNNDPSLIEPPDLLHIDRLAFVGKARIAGDHEQPADARERSDDLLDHAVGEILLLRVAAHVLERQHRDGRLVG